MKIVSCLNKFGALFDQAERDALLSAHKQRTEAGTSPIEAARAVVGEELTSAREELDAVNSAIFEAQQKKVETVAAPEAVGTPAQEAAMGGDLDAKVESVKPTDQQLVDLDPLFDQSTVPPPIENDGARRARPGERKTIISAMLAAFNLGVPNSWLGALRYFASDAGPFGQFRTRTNTVGFNATLLHSRGGNWDSIRAGSLIHEVHHAVDSDGRGGFLSIDSPLFATHRDPKLGQASSMGPLIKEADVAMMTTTDERLRMALLYALRPLMKNNADNERMDAIAKAELFAQLGRLYFTNPELMQKELPNAYAFFQHFNSDAYDHSTLQSSRDGLREALRTWTVQRGVRDNAAGRDGRGNGERAGQGRASAGMGAGPGVVDRGGRQGSTLGVQAAGLDGGAAARADRQGRKPLLVPDTGPRTPSFGSAIDNAVTLVGVHYGHQAGLDKLTGDKFGTGASGAEKSRVKWASDDRLKKRVYFYVQETSARPKPEGVVLGGHVYRVRLNNIYDLASDTLNLRERYNTYGTDQFRNDSWLESQIIDAGYDGYLQRDFSPSPAVVVLNKDVPVEYLGTRKEAGEERMAVDPVEPLAEASSLRSALQLAKGKVWEKGRDLKMAIQERVLAAAQAVGVDLSSHSDRATRLIVRSGVADALLALGQNANAIGWYDEKTRQALAVMALVHPEIATDENARFAFVWALAVTSNGMKVGKNFELAEAAYETYKQTGQMPTDLAAGQAQGAINDALALFNQLRAEWGIDDLRRFMQTNYTVGDITAISKALTPGGEHSDVTVRGAAILGPKIGNGFFSNLYGHFDALTMDRWLIRTWGRWTGTLIKPQPELTDKARARLRDAIAGISANQVEKARLERIVGQAIDDKTDIDALSRAIQVASMDPDMRAQLNTSPLGSELRLAGNSLSKYLDGQKEAPSGPNERKYIRKVFGEILSELRADPKYADLTMADLQAVLWYAEKRLYETAKDDAASSAAEGYNDDEAPDYANAASAVARGRGITERRIQNALKRESKDGRAANARPGNTQPAAGPQGQQGTAGGFTEREKRQFIRATAVRRVRSDRDGGQGEPRAYKGAGRPDGGKPGLLRALGVTWVREWKPGRSAGNVFRNNGIATPRFLELEATPANAQRFADAITAGKVAAGPAGAAVYVYPADEYQAMRLFLSEDGKTGVAIKQDGDIVSLFSGADAGNSALAVAVAAGGKKLDAFDTVLPYIYSAHGFVAVARLTWDDKQAPPGWDKAYFSGYNGGQPDVVFMVLDPAYTGRYSNKDGRRFTDYDAAVAAQSLGVRRVSRGRGPTLRHSLAEGQVSGMDQRSVAAAVSALTRNWGNAPNITVLKSPAQAPFKADPRARGAFWNGRVFLFADNLRNEDDLQFTLLHETAGHYGLRGLLGDALNPLLDRIFDTNANVREMAAGLMARYGYSQQVATEEAMSDLAGTGKAQEIAGWKMLVAAIRNAMRKLGFSLQMSDNDVVALLADAGRFVEKNRVESSKTLAPAYSAAGPTWYSELQAKVGALPLKAAPAQQWKATIAKMAGVKPDEIEWSGLNEWLDLQQGKVAKDAVLSYLRQNGVKVSENLLGVGFAATLPNGFDFKEAEFGWYVEGPNVTGNGATREEAVIDTKVKLEKVARQWQKNGDEEKAQRFFQMSDDLDSYLEGMAGVRRDLGLRSDYGTIEQEEGFAAVRDDAVVASGFGTEEAAEEWIDQQFSSATKFSGYQLPGGKDYRELLLTLPSAQAVKSTDENRFLREQGLSPESYSVPAFRSSHFNQPNILAHIRFNERTDADGKRVLFIEEIQSDWAQKGRKEGFNNSAKVEVREMIGLPGYFAVYVNGQPRISGLPTRQIADAELKIMMSADHVRGTPSAPFVTKTESWVALALKRAIRYAAENGFDRIAWTTGEQQAARYDLSKHVDSISYRKNNDGTVAVRARDFDGHTSLWANDAASENDIEETLGKDIARRIVDGPSKGTLRGVDLKVGGEGMTSFYDRIVPNVAKDVLKKLGGGPLTTVQMVAGSKVVDFDMRNGLMSESPNGVTQPGFDITPALRDKAMGGMPLFSNKPAGDALYSLQQQAQDKLHDFFTTTDSFNLWDRTVGTNFHKASKHAGFKKVYDGVQKFLNDASVMMMNAASLAPDLLPRMDSLKDVLKGPVNKVDMKAAGDAVFRGTLNDQVYATAAAANLTDKQFSLYQQARAAIDRSLQETFASEAVKQAKGLLPQAVLDQAKESADPWTIVGALAQISNRTPVQEQVYNDLRLAAAKMSDLQRDGYAPLMRFGRYTLHVSDAQGNSQLFTMHESEMERNALEREVRADPQFAGMTIKPGSMSQDAWTLFNGVSPDAMEVFAQSLGVSGNQVFQQYLKQAVNNRSVLKRLLQRKSIAGFSDDVQRTLAQFVTSNSRAASRNYHWGEILKAANDIPKEDGQAKDEAIALVNYMQHPKDEAGAIRGLLFVQFLGGSVASALTNATQPIMMTLPYLSQYGAANASKALLGAAKVAAGGVAEPDLARAMAFATKEGIIAPHEVADLYAEGIRNFGSNIWIRKGLKVWGSMFSLAEAWNRRLTFVAAFRMARDQGLGNPLEFATNAIAETQGVYNRGNRPNWARGPVGATLMTFKQYSIAYLEFLTRLPRKQQMMALALLIMGAGLQGLPGADDLEDVIDTIAESLGYSFNSKKAMRKWAVSVLGDDLGSFLVLGFSGIPGVPLDVSGRLGIGNLIPGTALLKRSETNKTRDIMEIFGPAGSQFTSFVEAFGMAQEGDIAGIAKSAMPVSYQNAMKAMDMAQSGYYRDRQGRRVTDVTMYDAMIKGMGFQPQSVARVQRQAMDVQQDVNLVKAIESKIVARWAQGIVDKDPDRVAAARAELLDWNMKNPDWRIRITPLQIQQRIKQAMLERDVRMIKSAPPEVRAAVQAELR